MHEWALVEAIIAAASKTAEKKEIRKVTRVTICIGELQQIEREIFDFALLQLRPAKWKKTAFKIKIAKAKLQCRACGHKWYFAKQKLDKDAMEAIHFVPEIAHTYVKCPDCGSPDFEILEGRGVWLESIEGAK